MYVYVYGAGLSSSIDPNLRSPLKKPTTKQLDNAPASEPEIQAKKTASAKVYIPSVPGSGIGTLHLDLLQAHRYEYEICKLS